MKKIVLQIDDSKIEEFILALKKVVNKECDKEDCILVNGKTIFDFQKDISLNNSNGD